MKETLRYKLSGVIGQLPTGSDIRIAEIMR
nr:unnamed protein product [Callosobruchus chinensis]CAH7765841.1 unnamed protein product [Callosobruchus chinensis]